MSSWDSIYVTWNTFSSFFQFHYLLLTLILLSCTFLLTKRFKAEAYNWMYLLNMLIPWVVLVDCTFFISELFLSWYGQNSYELYAFTDTGIGVNAIYILFVISTVATFMHFFKGIRTNRLAIALILLLRNAGWLWIKAQEYYGDLLPSSWSNIPEPFFQQLIHWLLFAGILGLTYWWLFKRNKLPCPSIFKR